MSFEDYELSVNAGQPIELYLFVRDGASYCFTNHHEEIEYLDNVYEPSSIKRDRIKQTMDTFKNDIYFVFPRTNSFAFSFIQVSQEHITTVTIFKTHIGDSAEEYTVDWKGRVIGGEITGNEVRLFGESIYSSIRRIGIKAKFEYNCRHPLYSSGCGLNKSSFATAGVVSSISDDRSTLIIPAADALDDNYFRAGYIQIGSSLRFITSHIGSEIKIMSPYMDDIIGENVVIYAGCDHLKDTCKNKFNNSINYGGFAYIPDTNPFKISPF